MPESTSGYTIFVVEVESESGGNTTFILSEEVHQERAT